VIPDVRGSGQSEGRVQDEYVKQEQDDAVELIDWISKQPWCNGKVGMFGSSWSGFNALQVAARKPPALKAIIAQCCSDDRYEDDAHYLGGCLAQEMFVWGALWMALSASPPSPEIVGDRWREIWLERLNHLQFFVGDWMSHQHRDSFWRHGSVCEDYSRIECPVYAVGGWVDSYYPAVFRMLAGLSCPRKGLIGPWAHSSFQSPGPAIDWLGESLRWWDYWLKGIDTGIMAEPMLRVWMQHEAHLLGMREVRGHWVAEETWPSQRTASLQYYLTSKGLSDKATDETSHLVISPQTVGIAGSHLCPYDLDTEAAADQRIDDARSLTFDSEPLQADIQVLGAAVLTLDLMVDKPVAFLAVRLNEVSPTGASTRITFAVKNLTHRESRESPAALEPGRKYRVDIRLREQAHLYRTGNRLRVALSTTYWPLIWPTPEPVTLTVFAGQSELSLPIRSPGEGDQNLRPFGENRNFAARGEFLTLRQLANGSGPTHKTFHWDVRSRKLTIASAPADMLGTGNARETLEIRDCDPISASLEYKRDGICKGKDYDVRVETLLTLRVTKDQFVLKGEVRALDAGQEVFMRRWNRIIARQLN